MDPGVFWRALGVQTLVVASIFVLLLALPLERNFFRDWGSVTGPLAWIAASGVTWRALSLRAREVAFAAITGGVAGLAAGFALGHGPGLLVSLVAFAALYARQQGLRLRASR